MTKAPNGKILDRNIALLLRRAYVPALPSPEFRRELAQLWLSEVRRAARDTARTSDELQPTRQPTRWGAQPRGIPTWTRVAVAAALVAGIFIGWSGIARYIRRSTELERVTPDEIVAAGNVAVRLGASGVSNENDADNGWRAATREELAQGLRLESETMALRTPAEATAVVRPMSAAELETGAGRILAHASTSVTLTPGDKHSAETLSGRLVGGTLTLERKAIGSSVGPTALWTVRTEPGALLFAHGTVEVEKAGSLERFSLANGEAWYDGPEGRIALTPGGTLRVFAGVPSPEPASIARAAAGARSDVGREALPLDPTAAPEPAQDELPRLVGRVIDADGLPVSDFRVALLAPRRGNEFEEPDTNDFDNADGSFEWTDLEPGPYTVFVHAAGYAIANLGSLELRAGSTHTLDPVQLTTGGTIRGFVVDPESGAPVPGAFVFSERDTPQTFVRLEDPGRTWIPISTHADSGGGFELEHVSAGSHTLHVSAPGYAPSWTSSMAVVDGEATAGVRVELGRGGSVEGLVTKGDGTPWADALLIVVPMDQTAHPQMNFVQVHTGLDGGYRADHLPSLSMLVVLIDPEHPRLPRVKPVEIRFGRTVRCDFEDDGTTTRFTGHLRTSGGDPVPNQNVALFEKTRAMSGDMEDFEATTTDDDGRFAFDRIASGWYLAYAVETTGLSIHLIDEIEVPEWPEFEHDFTIADYAVTGTVRDGRTGEPLANVNMILGVEDADGNRLFAGQIAVESNGRFEIRGLNAGSYLLTAYPGQDDLGFERSDEFVLNEHEPSRTIDFALFGGASVDVEVVEVDGTRVPMASVLLIDAAGFPHSFERAPFTDDAGHFDAVGLRPGTYIAVAEKKGLGRGSTQFECRLTETNKVRIVLAKSPRADDYEQGTGNSER